MEEGLPAVEIHRSGQAPAPAEAPRGRGCAADDPSLPSRLPGVQGGEKSERLCVPVAEARVQRAGRGLGGGTASRPGLDLAKLPLHLSVHGLRKRCLPLTELILA